MTPTFLAVLVGIAATITVYVAQGVLGERIPPVQGVVGGMAGTGLWALIAYQSLDVTIGTDAGAPVHETWLPLAFIAMVLALVCVAITLLDGVEMARGEVDL